MQQIIRDLEGRNADLVADALTIIDERLCALEEDKDRPPTEEAFAKALERLTSEGVSVIRKDVHGAPHEP